jgi:GDP-D-mannose dehydratase
MRDNYLKEYKGKTVLITGGAGCIGSNLTKALIKAEATKIIVLDDLSAAARWNVPVDPGVVFIKGSILDDEVLKRAFSPNVDYVFHLAAHFANQNSVDNPETDLLVNGQGTIKVLQYAHLARVTRLVFASSGCSVYGSQAPLPLKEDFVSLHLDTPFDLLAESRAIAILSDYGMGFKTKILEAIYYKCYVLVTNKLYRRLPIEVKPYCIVVDTDSSISFRDAMERCLQPYPDGNPNEALRSQAFTALDELVCSQA